MVVCYAYNLPLLYSSFFIATLSGTIVGLESDFELLWFTLGATTLRVLLYRHVSVAPTLIFCLKSRLSGGTALTHLLRRRALRATLVTQRDVALDILCRGGRGHCSLLACVLQDRLRWRARAVSKRIIV